MPLKFQLPIKGKKKRNVLGLSLATPPSPSTGAGLPSASTNSEVSDKSASSGASIPNSPDKLVTQASHGGSHLHAEAAVSYHSSFCLGGQCLLEEDSEACSVNREDFVEMVSETRHKFRSGDIELNPQDLEVLGTLGAGVSGVVEKVRHIPTDMIMARKLIHIELKPSVRKQILTELKVLYEAKSPYVVGFYGSAFVDDDLSIFMEFMDAGSLEGLYKRAGVIPEPILRVIARNIVLGLHELRANHCIVHRDIKPSNILMNTKGEVKLCDFGVSGQLVNSIAQTFTGTRSYMAPERLLGAQYATQSDVWSLGLSLFEMAVGRFPIPPEGDSKEGMAIFELMEYIVNGPAPSLPSTFSTELQGFISQCLIKDASKRPSPGQLLDHPWVQDGEDSCVHVAAWVRQTLARPLPEEEAPH